MLSMKSVNVSMQPKVTRVAQPSVVVKDRVVVAKKKFAIKETQVLLLCIIALLMAGIMVTFNMEKASVRVGYAIDKSQNKLVELHQENDRLHLDVAKLKSPSRIQTIALKDLGMSLPQQFVYSSDKASVVTDKTVVDGKIHD